MCIVGKLLKKKSKCSKCVVLKFLRTVSFKDEESESAFMFSVSTTSPSVFTVAGSGKKRQFTKTRFYQKLDT